METSKETVLVTGGSGFLGAHTIVQLLQAGYMVRTTVRSPQREDDVRLFLRAGGISDDCRLSFAVADLMNDDGWQQAMEGVSYVLHTASPFPGHQPADENELLLPARDGTLRVLKAARNTGVKRVVITSSFAAYRRPVCISWSRVGTPATYGFAVRNGRTLADNAPEAMLSLAVNTAVPSGLKPSVSQQLRSKDFPYVVSA
jgi:nucleoside-diphosphate-sugar epimerase